jgi:hypothetical protein
MLFLRHFAALTLLSLTPLVTLADSIMQYGQTEFVTPVLKAKKTEIIRLEKQLYKNQAVLQNINSEIQLILRLKSETDPDTFLNDFMLKHPDIAENLALTTLVTGVGIKVFNEFHRWEDVRQAAHNNPTAHKEIQVLRSKAMHIERTGYRFLVAGAAISLWSILYDTFNSEDPNLAVLYHRFQTLKDQPEIIEGMLAGKLQERIRLSNLISQQKETLSQLDAEFAELQMIEEKNVTDQNQKNIRNWQPVFVR